MSITKEELSVLFLELKTDIKADMREIIKDELSKLNWETVIAEQTKQIAELRNENESLREELQKQRSNFEFFKRQNNVVIYGLEEKDKETAMELKEYVTKLCKDVLEIELRVSDINLIKRLGQKNNNVRPVLLACTSNLKKVELLSNAYKLKGRGIYIGGDFEKEVRDKRNELFKIKHKMNESGHKVMVRGNGLLVDGKFLNYEKAVEMFERGVNLNEETEERGEEGTLNTESEESKVVCRARQRKHKQDASANITNFFRPARQGKNK
jgi:hypothetical protein